MKKTIFAILLVALLCISGANALFSNNVSVSTNNDPMDLLNNTLLADEVDTQQVNNEQNWFVKYCLDYVKEQPNLEIIAENLIRVTVGNVSTIVEYEPFSPAEDVVMPSVEDEYGPNYDDCYVRCSKCHSFVPIGNTVANSLPDKVLCHHFHGSLNPADYNFNEIFTEKYVQDHVETHTIWRDHAYKICTMAPVDYNNPDAIHGQATYKGEPMDLIVKKVVYDDDPDFESGWTKLASTPSDGEYDNSYNIDSDTGNNGDSEIEYIII